jgi:hypothetical protein
MGAIMKMRVMAKATVRATNEPVTIILMEMNTSTAMILIKGMWLRKNTSTVALVAQGLLSVLFTSGICATCLGKETVCLEILTERVTSIETSAAPIFLLRRSAASIHRRTLHPLIASYDTRSRQFRQWSMLWVKTRRLSSTLS